jgi:hypothetical protein
MKRAAEILRCAARDQQVEDHIIFKACNYAKAVRMVLAARKTRIPITSFCLQYWGTTSACAGPAAISATTAFWLCTTTGALVVLLHLLLISCSSFTSANRCFSTAPPSGKPASPQLACLHSCLLAHNWYLSCCCCILFSGADDDRSEPAWDSDSSIEVYSCKTVQ